MLGENPKSSKDDRTTAFSAWLDRQEGQLVTHLKLARPLNGGRFQRVCAAPNFALAQDSSPVSKSQRGNRSRMQQVVPWHMHPALRAIQELDTAQRSLRCNMMRFRVEWWTTNMSIYIFMKGVPTGAAHRTMTMWLDRAVIHNARERAFAVWMCNHPMSLEILIQLVHDWKMFSYIHLGSIQVHVPLLQTHGS